VRLVLRIVGGALWHLLLLASLCVLGFGPISRGYRRVSEQLAGHGGGFVLNHLGWCLLATAALLGLAVALMTEVWVLDWDDVRTAPDPHAVALDFARSAFQHACTVCDWDPALSASAEGSPPPVA
jgi:Family of unknown function (DUF5996)